MGEINSKSDWKYSFEKLSIRLVNAFKKSALLWTFIIGIVGVSSAGIWLPYAFDKDVDKLFRADALLTYCIAIISSVVIDFFLDNNFQIESKTLGIISFGVVLLSIFFLVYYYSNNDQTLFGIIGTILTLTLWLLCNANNTKYDEVNNSASIGGDRPSKAGLSND